MTITILDGGLGQEIVTRTGNATALWSVQALLDCPDTVRQIHADFFTAGAEIATANTYCVLPDRLIPHGLEKRLEELTEIACLQANSARDAHGSGRIAGSLGPLGFSYQPDQCPPADSAAEVYYRVCKAQSDFVDFFLAETMASVEQVKGVLMGTSGFDKPVWVAVTVDDTRGSRLRSGEALTELFPLLSEYDVQALLINCSKPEAVSEGVSILADQPITYAYGAYANGFTGIHKDFNQIGSTVDLLESRTDLDPGSYANFAAKWIADGAKIVGGCCEVGPAHISELRLRFASDL
jgi:S-methylmethionine-dependent homocysteine/selenocysteine methylase